MTQPFSEGGRAQSADHSPFILHTALLKIQNVGKVPPIRSTLSLNTPHFQEIESVKHCESQFTMQM